LFITLQDGQVTHTHTHTHTSYNKELMMKYTTNIMKNTTITMNN